MSEEVLLNIIDPQIMGAHMKTLIDLWVDDGLTDVHCLALDNYQTLTEDLDARFIQALMFEVSWYDNVFKNILFNLEDWEELQAWQEVCFLKRHFNGTPDFVRYVCAPTKRYTLIMVNFFSQKVYSSDNCMYRTRGSRNLIPYFWETSRWYRTKFHQYQDRQSKRLHSLENSSKASLASGGSLYMVVAEDVYPSAWIQALEAWNNPGETLKWTEALPSRQVVKKDALVEEWIGGSI